jgi:hypothetical protein
VRRVVVVAAVIAAVPAGGASATALRIPAWAKPLIAQLAQGMGRPPAPVLPPPLRGVPLPGLPLPGLPLPGLPLPRVGGFTCYIDAIGSAIALGAGSPCDRPAVALPILGR